MYFKVQWFYCKNSAFISKARPCSLVQKESRGGLFSLCSVIPSVSLHRGKPSALRFSMVGS